MILFQNCTAPFHTILHFAMLMTIYIRLRCFLKYISRFIWKKPSIELRQAIHRNDIAYKNHPKTKLRNIKKKINHNIETNRIHIPVQSIRIYTRHAISQRDRIGMEEEICLLFLSGILIFFFWSKKYFSYAWQIFCPH